MSQLAEVEALENEQGDVSTSLTQHERNLRYLGTSSHTELRNKRHAP